MDVRACSGDRGGSSWDRDSVNVGAMVGLSPGVGESVGEEMWGLWGW